MAVTVSVRPASSSFFAGEQFLCYITFTNTAQPQPQPQPGSAYRPGDALTRSRAASQTTSAASEDGAASESAPSENGTITDTASVAGNGSIIVHQQHEPAAAEPPKDVAAASPAVLSKAAGALPARKPSTPIGRAHPHSRKMSIRNDFHLAFPDEPAYSQPASVPASIAASESSGSVVLAPLTPRRASASPLFPSSAAASSTTSLASLVDNSSPRRFSLNSSELRDRVAQTPGSVHILWSFAQLSGSFQLDESIIKPAEFNALKQRLVDLSSSASTGGVFGGGGLGHDVQLDVDERVGWGAYLKNALTAPVSPSLSSLGLGGPSNPQDWAVPTTPRGTSRHLASASLAIPNAAGAANSASPSPIIGPSSPSVSRRRVSHKHTGSTLQDNRERTLMNRNIPTLSTPPSILFVDHVLAPGESKTYSFRLPLPLDLPPSFLGRSIQFTYNLTIGVNRSPQHSAPHSPYPNLSSSARSKLFNIPVRVYNNVALPHGEPAFWDLGNPVIKGRDDGVVRYEPSGPPSTLTSGDAESLVSIPTLPDTISSSESKGPSSSLKSSNGSSYDKNLFELQNCARALLGLPEEPEPGQEASSKPALLQRPNLALRRSSSSTDAAQQGEGGAGAGAETHSCTSATDILATNSPKVSYDISKDGSIAAVLTLVRSRYRLGDSVQGVVSINAKGALTRIVRVAITLESHEDIEPSLSIVTPVSKAVKATRIVHAEHHESTLDKGRVPFSLSIPSIATPDFKTSAVKLKWTVKLSLLTLASVKHPSPSGETLQPSTPTLGHTPSTPGSTASSAPSTPGEPVNPYLTPSDGGQPAPAPRLPPPPHLMPSKADGFALYHSAWRAVKHLAGPGVGTAGNPTMLAPVTVRRVRAREETAVGPSSESATSEGQVGSDGAGEKGEGESAPLPTALSSSSTAKAGEDQSAARGTGAAGAGAGADAEPSGAAGDISLEELQAELPVPAPVVVPFANETRLEIVECAVPVRILPSTTNFAVGDFVFEA